MALILNIETSASICSVCLAEDGNVLHEICATEPNSHAKGLTIQIDRLFRETNRTLQQLDAVAISAGPGSYTGLRIGASVAKGLCFSLNKPLIAISTLQGLAFQMRNRLKESQEDIFYLPIIDARKGAFYSALYDKNLTEVGPQSYCKDIENVPFRFNPTTTVTNFNDEKILMLGLNYTFALIIADIKPVASSLASLSFQKLLTNEFENTSLYEPNYIAGFGSNL